MKPPETGDPGRCERGALRRSTQNAGRRLKLTAGMRTIPFADRFAFDFWFALQCHFSTNRAIERRKNTVRARIIRRLRALGPRSAMPIDRVKDLSPDGFKRHYVA